MVVLQTGHARFQMIPYVGYHLWPEISLLNLLDRSVSAKVSTICRRIVIDLDYSLF